MLIQDSFEVFGADKISVIKVKNDFTLIIDSSRNSNKLFYDSVKAKYLVSLDLGGTTTDMLFINMNILEFLISTEGGNLDRAKSSLCEKLKGMTNTICIIDEADYILNDEAIKYINSDKNNQYIIFGRDSTYLTIT